MFTQDVWHNISHSVYVASCFHYQALFADEQTQIQLLNPNMFNDKIWNWIMMHCWNHGPEFDSWNWIVCHCLLRREEFNRNIKQFNKFGTVCVGYECIGSSYGLNIYVPQNASADTLDPQCDDDIWTSALWEITGSREGHDKLLN